MIAQQFRDDRDYQLKMMILNLGGVSAPDTQVFDATRQHGQSRDNSFGTPVPA